MSALDNYQEIPIKQLKSAPWNYKEQDAKMQEALVENIRANGQLENIIVRTLKKGEYEVINGNHRLDAFKTLGYKTVICYNVGTISEAHAAKIAIETNETKFKADNIKLSKLLADIKVEFNLDDLAKTMPFSLDEIKNFTNLTNFDWTPAPTAPAPEEPELNGGAPEKSTGAAVEKGLPDNRVLQFKLPSDVAESFEAALKRIKKIMYPDQLEEHVSATLPIQAMLQIIAQTDDEAFK